MFIKTFQKGRREQKAEAYAGQHVEDLCDARTLLAAFFNIQAVWLQPA